MRRELVVVGCMVLSATAVFGGRQNLTNLSQTVTYFGESGGGSEDYEPSKLD